MIPVKLGTKPDQFDVLVHEPGMTFLTECALAGLTTITTKDWKGRDYWTKVKPELRHSFSARCAYLAMLENGDGEVDHFVSKTEDPQLAYVWENYRFCGGEINRKKSARPAAEILDPLIVQPGWFKVHLVSGQLMLTDEIPATLRDKAEFTITALALNKRSYKQTRCAWIDHALAIGPGEDILELLDTFAPLIGAALRQHWGLP